MTNRRGSFTILVSTFVWSVCVGAFPERAAAMVKARAGSLPDYDAAGGLVVGEATRAAPSPAKQAALEALEQAAGAKIRMEWNTLSQAPRSLVSTRPLSSPSSGLSETVARDFIRTNKGAYGFSDQEINALQVDSQYTDVHSGITHIYYRQVVNGIPVYPSSLSVHLNSRGQVLTVQGDVFPGVQAPAAPGLSQESAAEAASEHVGVDYRAARIAGNGDHVTLDKGPYLSPVHVTQVIYPLLGTPKLGYRMLLEKNGQEWYDVIVDANTGQLLNRRNLYAHSGVLTPSDPAESNPAAPRGLVYVEHPLSTVRGTGDLIRKYPYTVDPTSQARGFANVPLNGADGRAVTIYGGEPQVAQTVLPFPDAANPVRSSSLPLSSSPQSPAGWFTLQGGQYQTIGNNVDAKDDHASDNEATIGLRAAGGTNGDFGGAAFVYQNHYAQNGPYASTTARLAGAAPDLPAVTVNLFYLCNWYHDFLHHLGFTEPAGNFQQDNFGRGGAGGDSLYADAQDGSGTDNANFGTPPDGSHPRMQMFLFTGPLRDGDLDFDVVIHEYTHGLSNRLVGGPNNTSCLGVGLVGEAGGMGEGWGDWYGAVISDEPAVGEYLTGDGAAGIRRFSMDNGPDDFSYGFICSGPVSNPSLVPCEVHDIGEFWSIVLWEMREAMINRFHNRAYPNGPTFPTFTVAGSPGGNIRHAQGRTSDGSGNVSMIDNAVIENATFAALFDVTDGMKLAPCNPTMVNMRDAILAAERDAGGELVDVIWRTFANRGVGAGAFSSGSNESGMPVIVEDFAVPQTVLDCETAGGPLPAPAFTAISNSPNTVDITITPNGAAQYIIYRGLAGAGTAIQPAAFVEIARSAATTFSDTNRDGGITHYYRVRAARNDDCISDSNVVSVVPQGGALPCSADPSFAGVKNVLVPGDCQHLLLDWAPAVSNCSGGQTVRYNIYRDTSATFTPSAGNRIATGVVGNSYADTPGTLNTILYYVVRAEDSTTGNGGPANGGNEDTNTIRRPGMVTSASLLSQGFSDDAETGPDNQSSAHFTSNGFTSSAFQTRGGWFRDTNTDLVTPHSPGTMWHTYDPDNKSVAPSGSLTYELTSDVVTITPESILTFYHAYLTEAAFDGGVVEAAIVDGTTGLVGAFQDVGHLIYENGYNGVLDAEGSDNALANRPAYTGGTLGAMIRSRVFLGALVPPGESEAQIEIRFVFGSDVANTITVPPVVNGSYYPGWYIDDISLDESCCPISAAPTNLQAAAAGDNQIVLTWASPGGSISQYLIFREEAGNTIPVVFANQIGAVPGGQTTFTDTQAAGGITYAYVVRAIPASGCPSGDSNVAVAETTGACVAPPTFSGIRRIGAPPVATCGLDLAWQEAIPNCIGATVRYNIYRSTSSAFTPAPANNIALGVEELSFRDQSNLVSGTTYYYIVRAEDSTSGGGGPANGGNTDSNLLRLSGVPQGQLTSGPDFSDDMEPAANAGYSTFSTRDAGGWTVIADATAHSATNAWVVLDDQPGSPTLTQKDDRLTLPPVNLSSASVMTFWHNYDFARFASIPMVQDAEYHSGGILEISADGQTWFDLGPYITAGGYTGEIDAGAQNPLIGRSAWVGSSDNGPDNPAPGRADAMTMVSVNLGAAIQDPAFFGVTTLPAAQVRFRMGGTFQVLIGGLAGSGWGVDDIIISNVLTATACSSCASCVGDLNGDGALDARDVSTFVECMFGACSAGACSDLNGDGVLNEEDAPPFVEKLLQEADHLCP